MMISRWRHSLGFEIQCEEQLRPCTVQVDWQSHLKTREKNVHPGPPSKKRLHLLLLHTTLMWDLLKMYALMKGGWFSAILEIMFWHNVSISYPNVITNTIFYNLGLIWVHWIHSLYCLTTWNCSRHDVLSLISFLTIFIRTLPYHVKINLAIF